MSGDALLAYAHASLLAAKQEARANNVGNCLALVCEALSLLVEHTAGMEQRLAPPARHDPVAAIAAEATAREPGEEETGE